ncbi:hypothetical protein [Cupriavidus necator]
MRPSPTALTSEDDKQQAFRDEVICLYEHEPDLLALPGLLFASVARLTDGDVVSYAEFHQRSKEFRALVSVVNAPYGRDRFQVGLGGKLRTGSLTFGLDYNVTFGMGGLQQGVRLMFAAPF